MLNNMLFGRFVEVDSILHRVDPQIKIVAIFLLIISLFTIKNILFFMLIIVFSIAIAVASGFALRDILRGLKPIMLLALIASVYNLLFSGGVPLSDSGILKHFTQKGILSTVETFSRLIALTLSTVLVTATTPPIALMNAMARLMLPLQRFGFPVTKLSIILSLSFNFIPMVAETAQALASSYLRRTKHLHGGNFIRKGIVCSRLLAPLLLALFKKGDEFMKQCQGDAAETVGNGKENYMDYSGSFSGA